jgi:hypothetical protein
MRPQLNRSTPYLTKRRALIAYLQGHLHVLKGLVHHANGVDARATRALDVCMDARLVDVARASTDFEAQHLLLEVHVNCRCNTVWSGTVRVLCTPMVV